MIVSGMLVWSSFLICVCMFIVSKALLISSASSCRGGIYYCLLDLSCGECNVISLHLLCCSVNGSVCPVCCMLVNCLVITIFMS